ncbi:MAG: PAS domain-containing sensor histidine kinase, partial [Fulvivirga sp.]
SPESGYLSLIFQNTSDLFCLLGVRKNDLIILSVNPSYVKAAKEFNPRITPETFLGRSVREVMEEEYCLDAAKVQSVLEKYEETLKSGEQNSFTEEIEFRGIIHYYSSTITPIIDSKGICTHLLYSSKDITDKKNYELDLKAREKKFRALIENSYECIALFDAKGYITYASPSIKAVAGYEEENFAGRPRVDFIHPDDIKQNTQKFKEVVSKPGGSVSYRFRLRHAKGHYLWVETTLTNLLLTPEVGGVVSNFRDITIQKLAEDQIKETGQLLESINQNINEGIHRSIPGKHFKYVNQAFLKMFGFQSLKALNKANSVTLYASASKRDEIYEMLYKHKSINNAEVKFKRTDGSEFWGLYSCSLSNGSDGEDIFDGAVRDITEIKLAEEKLTQLNEELRKQNLALASREEELNIALQELSDRNFELDQLVYKTSHDLRSPLTSILGLVNIAKIDNDPKQQEAYLTRIEKSILKLDEFVKSMLNYAKSSRTEIKMEPFELHELIENCVSDLEYLENFQKVSTNINIRISRKPFLSDPLKLKIIFSNIISNAYKYINPAVDNSFLNICAQFKATDMIITFTDNGIGIPENHQNKIFDMFYRATEISEGSGLGMYIVKQSVNKLGGSITVESAVNKGTTFSVVIPIG